MLLSFILFTCQKAAYEQGSGCVSVRLSEPELEAVVLEHINQELGQKILDRKDQEPDVVYLTTDNRRSRLLSVKEMKKKCMVLEQKQDFLKREKQYLYERYKLDQMERGVYLNRVGALREEESRLSEQLQKIQDEREQHEEGSSSHQEEAEYTGKIFSLQNMSNDISCLPHPYIL